MSKAIKLAIDEENKKLQLTGLSIEPMSISFESNIDYTDLVDKLSTLLDSEETLTLEIEDYNESDAKLKLIVDTTIAIFDKYSESLAITLEDDEDLPFSLD